MTPHAEHGFGPCGCSAEHGFGPCARSAEHGFGPCGRSAEHGFTLVEMLVALVIFGLVAAAGTALLASSVDAQGVVAERLDQSAGLRRIDALAGQDFAAALPRAPRGRADATAFAGTEGTRVFALTRTGLGGAPGGTPAPAVRRVTWQLANGVLTRHVAAAADTRDIGPPVTLASDIASARVATRGDGDWQDGWRPASPDALPRAVDLRITFADGRAASLRFATGPGQ